jgi:hypothetical protein
MNTNRTRRRPPFPHRRYPSLSDDFGREHRHSETNSGSQPEDTFWPGYARLIAFIVFIVLVATIAANM